MKCENCGKENKEDALFCMECGHDLREDRDFSKTEIIKDKHDYYEEDHDNIVNNNSFKDDSMSLKQKGLVFGLVVVGLLAFSLIFNSVVMRVAKTGLDAITQAFPCWLWIVMDTARLSL